MLNLLSCLIAFITAYNYNSCGCGFYLKLTAIRKSVTRSRIICTFAGQRLNVGGNFAADWRDQPCAVRGFAGGYRRRRIWPGLDDRQKFITKDNNYFFHATPGLILLF